MSHLIATADRLRAVRKAREHFLTLWTLECIFHHTRTANALMADLQREPGRLTPSPIIPRWRDPGAGK